MKKLVLLILPFVIISNISFAREYKSSLVLDMDSGIVLQSYNPEEKIYPASLTKLMTLYITFEALDQGVLKLDQKLIVSKSASQQPASKLGLIAGDKISVEDSIKALVIKSANDCAMVLSENISGEEKDFATIMTRVASEIGMDDTTFKNSSGLNNNNQTTTAKDMALLALAIKRHFPHRYHYFNERSFSYKGRIINTHNNILRMYKGADGFKTGYTAASGYNLIASAKNDKGQRILGIVIGFKSPSNRDKEMVNLLDYGFEKLNRKTNMNYLGWKEKGNKKTTFNKNNKSNKIEIHSNSNYKYKIQIGAFSERNRAENYFTDINSILEGKYNYKNMIEVAEIDNNTLYKAQIYSISHNKATEICELLKSNNKECFVRFIQ